MLDVLKEEKYRFANLSNKKLIDRDFNVEGYKIAIERATLDLTPRTLTPRSVDSSKELINEILDYTDKSSFVRQIEDYFKTAPRNEKDFDRWHRDRCLELLGKIKKYYTNKNGSEIRYGKAQKIVNMTLKGCYCLNNSERYEQHFEHCHVALDSFTLAWYNRKITKEQKVNTVWSNLEDGEYTTIQVNIRKFDADIDLFDGLTPLQKEFLIWPLEIMINTVKEVNKCFGVLLDAPYVDDYFASHKLTNDLLMTNIILGKITPVALSKDFVNYLKSIPKNQIGKIEAAEFILKKYEK